MQFAFRRPLSATAIKLIPAAGVENSAIVRTLDKVRARIPNPTVVAEPTAPVGRTEIRETRLFCLE
jgi:hypothetical protein